MKRCTFKLTQQGPLKTEKKNMFNSLTQPNQILENFIKRCSYQGWEKKGEKTVNPIFETTESTIFPNPTDNSRSIPLSVSEA